MAARSALEEGCSTRPLGTLNIRIEMLQSHEESDYISGFLESQGGSLVLEMSGGMLIHMLDHTAAGVIQAVAYTTEQAAFLSADAMAST